MLINHYGLNVMDPQARSFLKQNMEAFLFKTGGEEDVDTTKKGTITVVRASDRRSVASRRSCRLARVSRDRSLVSLGASARHQTTQTFAGSGASSRRSLRPQRFSELGGFGPRHVVAARQSGAARVAAWSSAISLPRRAPAGRELELLID